MIYIKFDDGKKLTITEYEPIYRGENLNQKMVFLLPMMLNKIEVQSATIYLCYIKPDGNGDIVILEKDDEPYNSTYLQYKLPVDCKMARYAGDIHMWIQLYIGSRCNPIAATSSECKIRVLEKRDIGQYLGRDNPVTALYQMQKLLDESKAEIEKNVETAVSGKADDVQYDEETRELTLMSGESKIGSTVIVPGDSFIKKAEESVEDEWSDMSETDEVYEEWESM